MDLFKKQLLKTLLISTLCIFSITNLMATGNTNTSKISGVTTVMVESILKINTGQANNYIIMIGLVDLKTNEKYIIQGCNNYKCAFNLQFLTKGKYAVEITTCIGTSYQAIEIEN